MPLLTNLYKAFACIARDFTITKSEAYGFQLFKLVKNYLSNRKRRIIVNDLYESYKMMVYSSIRKLYLAYFFIQWMFMLFILRWDETTISQNKVSVVRGRSRTTATSKMEHCVIIVNGFQPSIMITKRPILDVAAVLAAPPNILITIFSIDWKQFTAWKVSKHGIFSAPYFSVFGLNTDLSVFSPNPGKYGPEKTLYSDTFDAGAAINNDK